MSRRTATESPHAVVVIGNETESAPHIARLEGCEPSENYRDDKDERERDRRAGILFALQIPRGEACAWCLHGTGEGNGGAELAK